MLFRRKPDEDVIEVPPVVVPASAVTVAEDDYELVNAVVQYVKTMTRDGCYLEAELDPDAVSAYWVDFYVGEVLAGGHWRYLETTGMALPVLDRVQDGIEAMGADPFDRVHRALLTWVEKNDARHKGLSFCAEHRDALDKLDRAFDRAGGANAVAQAAAAWIREFETLSVLRFDAYKAEIEALCESNPLAAERRRDNEIRRLAAMLRDPLKVGVGVILGRVHDGDYRPFTITGGTPVSRGEGESMMVWDVRSEHGDFQAIEMPERVAVFQRGSTGQRAGVGNLERDRIAVATDYADEFHVGLAAILLMEETGDETPIGSVVFEGRDRRPLARFRVLLRDGGQRQVLIEKRRLSLADPDTGDILARIPLKRLAREAEALAARGGPPED